MVRFEINSNPTGQYYLPKEVREELGRKLSLICGVKMAVLFPPSLPIKDAIRSLEIIKAELLLCDERHE